MMQGKQEGQKTWCNWIHVTIKAIKDEHMKDTFTFDLSHSNVILIANHGPATAQNHCFDIYDQFYI